MKEIITPYKYRLIPAKHNPGSDLNWLFLPGGLGFGSEYFIPFINSLNLPGNLWRCDFPEDGSNRFQEKINFDELWRPGLLDVVQSIGNVILITHSVSAMLALTVPELDSMLSGLVIISSAPSSKWREGVIERARGQNLPSISERNQIYEHHKSDESFKQFFLSILGYYISSARQEALMLFKDLPYHYQRYEWLVHHFHQGYQANWAPNHVPTLVLGSSEDIVTPISLFQEDNAFSENILVNIVNIPYAGHFPWIEQKNLMSQHLFSFAQD